MKLTAAARHKIPASKFGEPGERKYPMEDRGHQIAAKGRAHQQEEKGRLSASEASKIITKANRLMKGGK